MNPPDTATVVLNSAGTGLRGILLSPWLYAPVLFLVWLLIAFWLKRFVFRRIGAQADAGGSTVLRGVLRVLSAPLNLAIIIVGLWALAQLLPLPQQFDTAAAVSVRILLVIAGLVFLDRLVYVALVQYKERFTYIDITKGVVRGTLRLLIVGVGFLIVLDSLGISITPLVASLGIGSLAVALALQGPLSNLFAGLFVLADRTVRVGDFVKLDTGEEGYVTHMGWRHTRVRTLANIAVIVPNSRINTSVIQNLNLPQEEVLIFFPVGVSYASDLRHVEEVTLDVARKIQSEVKGAVSEFEPILRYNSFSDFSINFNIRLQARSFDATYLVKHEFIKALHERYRQEGIVIPFPIRTLDVPENIITGLRPAPRRTKPSPSKQ